MGSSSGLVTIVVMTLFFSLQHRWPDGPVYYKLSAYGREFFFNLTTNHRLASPGLSVEYWSRGHRKSARDASSDVTDDHHFRCHYVGHVTDDEGMTSEVALSDCYGLVSDSDFTSQRNGSFTSSIRVSPWPSGLNCWLRSFARFHVRVRGSSPATAHIGGPHTAALDTSLGQLGPLHGHN